MGGRGTEFPTLQQSIANQLQLGRRAPEGDVLARAVQLAGFSTVQQAQSVIKRFVRGGRVAPTLLKKANALPGEVRGRLLGSEIGAGLSTRVVAAATVAPPVEQPTPPALTKAIVRATAAEFSAQAKRKRKLQRRQAKRIAQEEGITYSAALALVQQRERLTPKSTKLPEPETIGFEARTVSTTVKGKLFPSRRGKKTIHLEPGERYTRIEQKRTKSGEVEVKTFKNPNAEDYLTLASSMLYRRAKAAEPGYRKEVRKARKEQQRLREELEPLQKRKRLTPKLRREKAQKEKALAKLERQYPSTPATSPEPKPRKAKAVSLLSQAAQAQTEVRKQLLTGLGVTKKRERRLEKTTITVRMDSGALMQFTPGEFRIFMQQRGK